MDSSLGASMTTTEFQECQRLVLKLAYEWAGYDVDEHTSETENLLTRTRKGDEGPLVIPLRSSYNSSSRLPHNKKRSLRIGDGIVAALVIDEVHGTMEIDGVETLKTAFFEVSSYIVSRVKELKEETASTIDQNQPKDCRIWLPYLPPGGTEDLTYTMAELYWGRVVPLLVPGRNRTEPNRRIFHFENYRKK